MTIPDTFQTIAEISIAFAGFTGLIVAFRKDAGPLNNVQKYRLTVLLSLAFGAMFLSLLPEVLFNLGARDAAVWFWACGGSALFSLVFLTWWLIASRRIVREVPEIFHWSAFSRMAAGHVVVLALQASVVMQFEIAGPAGILSVGLLWYLLHASQQFVRMLFIQPKEG